MKKQTEQEFLDAARNQLEQSAADIDSFTAARLKLARQQALTGKPSRPFALLPVGAAAAVVVAVLTVSLVWQGEQLPGEAPALESLELLSTVEELDLYENMEFYEWLPAGVEHAS